MFMRQLSYLIALDKHRHFGQAAESCHVSQPAPSNAISELERELGIIIVKRNRSFQASRRRASAYWPGRGRCLPRLKGCGRKPI